MKIKVFYFWVAIIFFSALPVGIDRFIALHNLNFPIIWTIHILPCILIIVLYPTWRVIIASGMILTLIKYTYVIIGHRWFDIYGILATIGGSIIFWTVLLTLGYFRLGYEKLLKQLNLLATVDSLTGTYNRRFFDSYLLKAITSSDNSSMVLNLVDIDHFKRINDTYGHICGDLALQHVSDLIKTNIRKSDVVARLGGEEFAVLLPNASLEEGKKICERIREAVEKTAFHYKNQPISLTISIGIANYDGEEFYEFIDKSDRALFKAKQQGRNQLAVALSCK